MYEYNAAPMGRQAHGYQYNGNPTGRSNFEYEYCDPNNPHERSRVNFTHENQELAAELQAEEYHKSQTTGAICDGAAHRESEELAFQLQMEELRRAHSEQIEDDSEKKKKTSKTCVIF